MSGALSYVFCLVRSTRPPSLRGITDGMPGGSDLRAVDVDQGLWAVVQSVRASEYGEEALAGGLQNFDWVGPRAIAHERVIEAFLSLPALLPMQLFTLFTSDARVVEHVRADRTRINRIVKRIEKKVEFGLRLTFADPNGARRTATKRAAGSAGVTSPRSGAAYLARKRDILDVNRTRLAEARKIADRLYKVMGKQAAASRRRTSLERAAPGSRLLLDAAFLVAIAKSGAFKSAIRQRTRELRGSGVDVSLTGPWPAYNFIQ
ncbi:MAG TPA: GvpL/GvpF family gas vesicle protein [Vicinamibacterales bacterium]|nr:GvpL/GvpF family gas vesicle protein [Vicinamibacterales bacterium]